MRTTRRLAAAPVAVVAALLLAIPATAAPQCTDTGPYTTICQTPGHAQITTSPNPALTNPYPGWGFGGIGIGLGGIWIGF
ncbi:hypothetical protein [Candidatus Mycolicibacterium alkanivorans]|uniref:Keratin associated protein n=1 Tax=Candidatus Mycolicibacterium alkanivorans TaxID=2954114 RepID=A0ABS9YTY0_9MYCO|nr:hypothetical protein [Candidatus Mycolicibacterium alkanivorans]MCI4674669.1 hypothetical protein [Candidatus Mycolicibacterium alkanivorans]